MDKKKLIGTIIGVILFGALIAGATFAWLSFNANVTVNFSFKTNTFYFDYQSATAIEEVPILISNDTHAIPGSGTDSIDLSSGHTIRRKLSITNNGKTGGTVWILLKHKTSGTDIVNSNAALSLLKYAVCKDNACDGDFTTAVMGRSTNNLPGLFVTSNVKTSPIIGEGTTTDQILYSERLIADETHTYYVYFWLDAERITSQAIGKTYSGDIYAYGIQDES